ncbi:MAG: DUF1441 family protein [Gammaproteobacteria bacterium]|nr:DUF1441 family protein [Gammaproteobacteria bacterium]
MSIKAAPQIPASRRANKAETAEFCGVSLPTINAWIAKGAPVLQKGSRGIPWVLDLWALAEWRFTGGAGGAVDEDVPQTPRERNDWYAAELKRLQFEKETGLLIAADDMRTTVAEALQPVMLGMETLTDVVERDAGLTPEQAAIIRREIDRLREALYLDLVNMGADVDEADDE